MKITIRKEQSADYPEVFEIVELAFRTMPFADGDEQFLVEELRKNKAFIPELSLVAEKEDKLVGHILFTPLQIINGDKVFNTLALAPVAVLPEYQNQGIGSKLIIEGHRIAKTLGFNSCFVLGHPDYYPRFGYKPAGSWSIPPPHGAPPEAFMAVELIAGSLNGVSGAAKFLSEFGV
jgi:predicted N-acetyltransferase YhbS